MYFSNLKIKGKIISVSSIIMATMIGIIVISYLFLGKIANDMETFYNVQYVNTKSQMEIRKDIQTINKRILVGIVSEDSKVINDQIADFDERFVKIDDIINNMDKTLGNKEMVATLRSSFEDLKEEAYNLLNMAKNGKGKEALKIYNTTFNDVTSEALVQASSDVGDLSDEQSETKYNDSMKVSKKAVIVLTVVMILGLIIIFIGFYLLIKNITNPIEILEEAANKMENGDFDIEIEYESNDELGSLAKGFAIMSQNTKRIIDDANRLLEEMSNRKFDVNSQCEEQYIGEYQKLYSGICNIRNNMSVAIAEVKQSSEQVKIGAEQVSNVSQHLSQGATEQSLSVEELSETIQEISEQTNSNVNNAIDTSNLAKEAGNGIVNANKSMKNLMCAIDEINTKANEIGKIIKTIDDIAFQTNILALNAAVEAARAGESGKGFAVVADEVRNLAGKSAEAAKDTSNLIKSAIDSIYNGTKIANETEVDLNIVVEKSEDVLNLVDQIVTSSENQVDNIVSIKTAIDQISQVVQNNSATAEEVAATSEELSGQANVMEDLVNQFTLDDNFKVDKI